MQPENFATTVLILVILGVVFYAGYGWRMIVERRLHNMPWLRRSARKAAEAAAPSNRRPIILPALAAAAEPLERQSIAANELPAPKPEPDQAPPPAVSTETSATTATGRRRRLSLRRQIKTE